MRRSNARFWKIFCAASALSSCLPHDTRPEPGSVFVTVTGSAPLLGERGSLTTDDGWTLSYDRLLISLGGASLEADACSSYYDADYRRIFDMRTAAPQKVGVVYALGSCDFGFRVSGPDLEAVLGEGVTATDKAFMGTPGTDPYSVNRGISLYASGSASKGGVTKRFAWAFRQRVRYESCVAASATPDDYSFHLKSGAAEHAHLFVHGETLFFDDLDLTNATARFDPVAAADDSYGDGDGEVTLSELGLVPLTEVATDGNYSPPPNRDAADWQTLEDFVYWGLFPQVVRFESDGVCSVRAGDSPR
jgi:hypothetical protein